MALKKDSGKSPGKKGYDSGRYQLSVSDKRAVLKELGEKILAARNLDNILIDLKDDIINYFNAERITIYVVDGTTKELVSRFMSKSEIAEIRIPISKKSIAGYAALNQTILNISDVSDAAELRNIDQGLEFDKSWDNRTGYVTRQVLAVPIIIRNYLMGVMEVMNRKEGGAFNSEDERMAQELARMIGVNLFNQKKSVAMFSSKFNYLIRKKLLSANELNKAISEAAKTDQPLETVLMSHYGVSRGLLGESLTDYYNVPFIEFDPNTPAPHDLLKGLRAGFLRSNVWVPVRKENDAVFVVIDDPRDFKRIDEIRSIFLNSELYLYVALKEDILLFIDSFTTGKKPDKEINGLSPAEQFAIEEENDTDTAGRLPAPADDLNSAVLNIVNTFIMDALSQHATDIHLEPDQNGKGIITRFRIDGRLVVYHTYPEDYGNELTARIKLMAGLNVAEHRRPQNGKIFWKKPDGSHIELLTTIIPVRDGLEVIAIKIAAPRPAPKLAYLGYSRAIYEKVVNHIERPYGLILASGPASCGKKTTLHSIIAHINQPSLKIWAIEDPAEIKHKNVSQVKLRNDRGFGYPEALKYVLMADPDVIMVGNMKDEKTAAMSVEAALGGKLVLGSVFADDAPDCITKFLEMRINSWNLSNALSCILAQRLVRILCPHCKTPRHPEIEEYEDLVREYGSEDFEKGPNIPYSGDLTLYAPSGCEKCNHTGYQGRTAIFECMEVDGEMKRMIKMKLGPEDLRWQAVRSGMKTLKQEGILQVFQGITDMAEIRRLYITA